ncbi:MAG TPA: GNAT family protein [Candidatus Limnocylindrales bacterium]|nr:GNAT family protein [Candidatus Limnocylindrales bacterium]
MRGRKTVLRAPTEADLVPIARWMADMRIRDLTSVWHEPAMPATWKERFAEQTKDKSNVLWAIDADGKLVGMVRAGFGWEPHRDNAHIDQFIVDPDHWRHGFGLDAAIALHRYFFDYLDLRRVAVRIAADAVGAKRIAEKLGYAEYARQHESRFRDGAYVDEIDLLLERPSWEERYASEREYQPLGGS